jgi:hypothetical protein
LQFDQHYVLGQAFKPIHATGELLDGVSCGFCYAVDFDLKIGTRAGAAKQGMTGFALGCEQGVFSMGTKIDLAVEYLSFARAANAGAATVRQRQAGIESRVEYGPVFIGGESMTTGLKLNLTGHNEMYSSLIG